MKNFKNIFFTMHRLWIVLVIRYSIVSIAATAAVPSDTLSFIHITDTHVIFGLTNYHPNIEQKRRHFGDGIKPLEHFFTSVQKNIQPDFMVITGDLIDFFGAEISPGVMVDTQVEQFLRLLDVNYFPVYLTLGNHDIASDFVTVDSYSTSQITAQRARAVWIRNTPCFKDGTYYSRVFKVDTTTYRLIFLDNSYYSRDRKKDGDLPFIIDKPQLYWLEDQMKQSLNDVEIIFMHMPIPDNYGLSTDALLSDSSKTGSITLFKILDGNPSARLIFMGHNHTNIIKDLSFSDDHKLTQVQTAAFGYDPGNWRLIKLTAGKILISNPGNPQIQIEIPIRKKN